MMLSFGGVSDVGCQLMNAESRDFLTATDAPAKAVPPRYGWLRRVAAAWAALLLIVLGLRLLWGWRTDVRLNAEIARLRAAGERVLPEDFVYQPLPKDANAAELIARAAEAITLVMRTPNWQDELEDEAVWTAEDLAHAATVLEQNAQVFELLDEARRVGDVAWPEFPLNVSLTGKNYWPQVRSLAKFLHFAARYHHQIGDHAAALDVLHRGRFLVAAQTENSGLIPHLVLLAVDARNVATAESMAPTFCASRACAAPDVIAAERDSLKLLIADLIDESRMHHSMRRAAEHERAMSLNTLRGLVSGDMSAQAVLGNVAAQPSLWERAQLYMLVPLAATAAQQLLAHSTSLEQFAGLDRSDELDDLLLGIPSNDVYDRCSSLPGNLGSFFQVLEYLQTDGTERFFYLHIRLLASRRLAAIRWALRIYELDHGGLPETLEVLVPDYLPRLPEDPFAAPGATFHYRPGIPTGVLYSISHNGEDDGGRRGRRIDDEDIVIFLDGVDPGD